MKYLVVFIAVNFVCGITAVSKVTEVIKEECRKEIELSKVEIDRLNPEGLTEKQMCYIKCLFTKGGYLSGNGKVEIEKMKNDQIADGNAVRLKKAFDCVGGLDDVKECKDVVGLVDCFRIQ